MRAFTEMIESLAELLDTGIGLCDFYEEVMHRTGYVDMLRAKPTEENQTRLENVRELKPSINSYVENADSPSLAGFLEEIALYTDIEQYDAGADALSGDLHRAIRDLADQIDSVTEYGSHTCTEDHTDSPTYVRNLSGLELNEELITEALTYFRQETLIPVVVVIAESTEVFG